MTQFSVLRGKTFIESQGVDFYVVKYPDSYRELCAHYFVGFIDKLDGIRPMKRKREESPPFLPSDDDDPYDEREEDMRIGKKRVRISSASSPGLLRFQDGGSGVNE